MVLVVGVIASLDSSSTLSWVFRIGFSLDFTCTPIQKMSKDNATKLHLCCGKRDFGKDWVNIDAFNADHIDYNIRNLDHLPFEDNRFDLIYCSHAIGYFDREEIKKLLAEWRRVLNPNGILRLATPDFDQIAYLYRTSQFELEEFLGLLYGKWEFEKGSNENHIYFKTTYDFASLKKVLEENGFSDVKHYDFRTTEHSEFDDHSKAHLPKNEEAIRTGVFKENQTLVSLNVECRK